jgi:hypothetical protein
MNAKLLAASDVFSRYSARCPHPRRNTVCHLLIGKAPRNILLADIQSEDLVRCQARVAERLRPLIGFGRADDPSTPSATDVLSNVHRARVWPPNACCGGS